MTVSTSGARIKLWRRCRVGSEMAGGWASLGLLPELVHTVEDDFHWLLPTAIQEYVIYDRVTIGVI